MAATHTYIYMGDFSHTLYIEMECSDVFGAGKGGLINPPDPNKYYTLRRADIVVKDPEIYQLLLDFEVLLDLIKVRTGLVWSGVVWSSVVWCGVV